MELDKLLQIFMSLFKQKPKRRVAELVCVFVKDRERSHFTLYLVILYVYSFLFNAYNLMFRKYFCRMRIFIKDL